MTTAAIVQIDPSESEALEIRFLDDPAEVVVLRHGMNYPEGGEAVYSELIYPGDDGIAPYVECSRCGTYTHEVHDDCVSCAKSVTQPGDAS